MGDYDVNVGSCYFDGGTPVEGGNTCVETRSTWGASVPSSQFWNEPKTALKKILN